MKVTLLASSSALLVGWALVESGQFARLSERFQRPERATPVRQVEVLAETDQYRVVKHALGETRVPLEPKRIVSLVHAATDSLVALGIEPVLASTSWRADSVLPYLDDRLRGVPKIRQGEAVDLEAVLEAKPDLIFANASRDGRLFNQLSKIAPTVCLGSGVAADRERRILDVGDALGLGAEARARLDKYYADLAQTREAVAAAAPDQPVSFLRFRRNTCVIYTRSTMFGPLLFEGLALTPDPEMPFVMTGAGWDVLSVERLSKLRSEYIFMVVDKDSELYLKRVRETPIWQDIPAVRHDHVARVDAGTWISGDGLLGCEAIVADVAGVIAPERSGHGLD